MWTKMRTPVGVLNALEIRIIGSVGLPHMTTSESAPPSRIAVCTSGLS